MSSYERQDSFCEHDDLSLPIKLHADNLPFLFGPGPGIRPYKVNRFLFVFSTHTHTFTSGAA